MVNKKYNEQIISSNLEKYCRKKNIKIKKYGNAKMLDCPFCGSNMSAQIIPSSSKINCLDCGEYYSLLDIARKKDYNGDKNIKDSEIIYQIKEELGLEIVTDKDEEKINTLLDFYKEQKFDMVQLVPNGKYPVEHDWPNKTHKKQEEWMRWVENKSNLGLKTGKISGITVVDIDKKEIPSEIKPLLENTLIQKTPNGWHYIYKYEKDLPKTRIDELKIDIENDGGQIVIAPSKTKNKKGKICNRDFKELIPPAKMPDKLKELLKKKSNVSTVNNSEYMTEQVKKELYRKPLIGESEGRNHLFISLFGLYRKFLSLSQTKESLRILDKVICDPPLGKELERTVFKSGEKYFKFDEDELANKVLRHLKEVKKSTKKDIELSVMGNFTKGEEKTRLSKALQYLIREGKIVESGVSLYEVIEEMDWTDIISNTDKPTDFKVPYFNDYIQTNDSDLIIVGGRNKTGKCLKDAYILSNKGLLTIEEIGKKRPDGFSELGKHNRIFAGTLKDKIYRHPQAFYKEKVNKTIKITTNFGYELEGTPEHPIKVIKHGFKNGGHTRNIVFKNLEDIKEGDEVILQSPNMFPTGKTKKEIPLEFNKHPNASQLKEFEIPKGINPTYAKLLGFIMGNGNLSQENTICIYQNKKDTQVIEELKRIGGEIGIKPSVSVKGRCVKLMFCSAKLTWWVRKKLLRLKNSDSKNITSPNRTIPKIIRTASKECQIAFIEALFSCEAYYTREGTLDITMSSEELIKALHIMLLNFGIISKRKTKKVKKYEHNTCWRLTLSVEMTNKFFEIFKPTKYKNTKIKKYKKKGFHIRRIGGSQYQEGFFINKVTKTEIKNKETYVYDFTMNNPYYKINHQFWSSGFISHNTVLCQNFLKGFVEQGIKPYYISNETGSRSSRVAIRLGLKDGDFNRCFCSDPQKVILPKNGVTIYDWVLPGDFARTDKLFNGFVEQLEKKGGILIAFVQLKEDDTFFAKNMIGNFPAVLSKYVWEDDSGNLTKFVLKYVRESKVGKNTNIEIPCKYNRDTMRVERIEDLMKGKK